MLKSYYGQVRVNKKLETFARDLSSLFISPTGCKTEMVTFHGDIFNCLGQGNTVYHSFFFLDRLHCAWSALPTS